MPENEIPLHELQDCASSLSSLSSRNSDGNNFIQSPGGSDSESSGNLYYNRREMPVYDPIIIPKEPSLDELLKQVSGTSELETVTEIRLRVVSHMLSLQRIHIFMPNLKLLNLDGSVVSSLRDLGCDMNTLRHLNVSRCGLRSLDGINGFLGLEELIADSNDIEDVSPCCSIQNIKYISLKDNRITNTDHLSFLELCPSLKSLNIIGNRVTQLVDYRNVIKQLIPQLVILDEIEFFDTECGGDQLSSSEYQSSSTTSPDNSIPHDKSIELEEKDIVIVQRPKSALDLKHEQLVLEKNERNLRPMSSTGTIKNTSSELTSGEPLCGNIIQKIRRRRQRVAWGDSDQSTSSSSSDSNSITGIGCKNFPIQLPQETVPLELGVIGVPEGNSTPGTSTVQSLLNAAKLWRQGSQKTRESMQHCDRVRILKEYSGDD